MLRVSVVICTYNRPTLVRHALQSLLQQDARSDAYEILVVDHSTDNETQEICEKLADFGVHVRHIRDDGIGLSNARNRGLREATGEIVAYIDDDAIAGNEWIEAVRSAFENVRPTPACVGGKVEGLWEVPRPAWLPKEFESYLSLIDAGDEPKACTPADGHLVGCNIAFVRQTLSSIGGFNPALGRRGGDLASNEEIAVQRRLYDLGESLYYEPRMRIEHLVPEDRTTRGWFVRRLFADGRSACILDAEREGATSLWYGKYATGYLLYAVSRITMALFARAPRRWIHIGGALTALGKSSEAVVRILRVGRRNRDNT